MIYPSNQMSVEPYISFLLPCYNESEVLFEMHRRVKEVGEKLSKPYEIVFVNDGSTDDTFHKMVALTERDPMLVIVDLSRNHGHQLALSAGLQCCAGERVLVLDADLQDPPELLTQMLELMDQGADVVFAQRRTRLGDAPLKRFACAVFYHILTYQHSELTCSYLPMPMM